MNPMLPACRQVTIRQSADTPALGGKNSHFRLKVEMKFNCFFTFL